MKSHFSLWKVTLLCFLLTFALCEASAQAYLVSSDSDNIICDGQTVSFVATPPLAAGQTYRFYRDNVVLNPANLNAEETIAGNRYTINYKSGFLTTPDKTFTVKVAIIANGNAISTSTEIKTTVELSPGIVIKQRTTNGGIIALPTQVLSSSPDIELVATSLLGNTPFEEDKGVFTGEGVRRSGASYIFSPAFVNAGRFGITYTYKNSDRCSFIVRDTITVNASGGAILGLKQIYCSNDGESTIGLSLQDITDRPYDPYYEGYPYMLKLVTEYRLVNITGKGVTSTGTAFKFNPKTALENGDKDSTEVIIEYTSSNYYRYFLKSNNADTLTCCESIETITDRQKVAISLLDTLRITNSGQPLKSSYCRNENLTLTGTPSGLSGKFTLVKPGPVTVNESTASYTLLLSDATLYPAGEYKVTYNYSNAFGCNSDPVSFTFTLLDVPSTPTIAGATLQGSQYIINYCIGDSILPLQLVVDAGLAPVWRRGDPNARPDTESAVSYRPKMSTTFANQEIFYVSQKNDACESSLRQIVINVSRKPEANFVFRGVCQSQTTQFKDQTDTMGRVISGRSWDFGDGDILPPGTGPIAASTHEDRTTGTYENPLHTYQQAGRYQVKLSLSTSSCPDDTTITVAIFPLQTAFPYLENFESITNGWVAQGQNSSWKLMPPAGKRIKPEPGSPQAWITQYNADTSYNALENSYVESPCFNLLNAQKPFLSFKLWADTEEGLDGAVVQYAIDNGISFNDELQWKVLGNPEQGIGWYNTSGIVGNPGKQNTSSQAAVGWSGYIDSTQWTIATYDLIAVKQEAGTNNVRFRIAFGSNSDNPPNRYFDGFAFDNFEIGEINRTILVEHFTNASDASFIEEDTKLNTAIADKDILAIQYHTSFPEVDSLNRKNTADPSARALLYGIVTPPRTVMDGILYQDKPFSANNWGVNAYSQRILFSTPFVINVSLAGGGEEPLSITAALTKSNSQEAFTHPLLIQVAIVEKAVSNEQGTFKNVLVKLLPDAAGKRLTGIWNAMDESRTETSTYTWLPNRDAAPDEYGVIVFVQDEQTKEVYQAYHTLISLPLKADPSSGGRSGLATGSAEHITTDNISVFPNPASGDVHITFQTKPMQAWSLTLYDAYGKLVATKTIRKGEEKIVLSTATYESGLYVIHIVTPGSTVVIRKKLAIVR